MIADRVTTEARRLAGLVCLGAALGMASTAYAQETRLDGRYELVQPPQPTDSGTKIEVLDVFWYGCPHCYKLLPFMERWMETVPDYVEVRRMPAVFRKSWVNHAKAYYTAELLGVAERIHRPLFDEIHQRGNLLESPEALLKFFVKQGVGEEDFKKTFDSFAVQSLVRRSIERQERYGVMGTPTVIVNGKYRVSATLAGGYAEMIEVTAALAALEQKANVASQ